MAQEDPARERARAHIPLLYAWTMSDLRPLDLEMFETDEHLSVAEAKRGPWKNVPPGTRWGKPWSTAWFRFKTAVPREWQGRTVAVRFLSGQGLVFRDGRAWQGLDDNHQLFLVADPAEGGERETVLVECGASGMFGRFEGPVAIQHAHLGIYNREFEHVVFEMEALLNVADELPFHDPLRRQILRALNRALNEIDRRLRFAKGLGVEPNFVENSRRFGETVAAPELPTLATPEEIAEAARAAKHELAGVQQPARVPYLPTLWAVGHAHIDLAWLWPLAETIRKCGRTWSTALRLIEEFPDYVFVASQGCEYHYCKERYPEVYAGLKRAVKAGRWEPLISMWVESDCIVNPGESLVRQFLWGVRWSRREFGSVRDVVWLPDAFGYCAQMPQIMRRAGMKFFCTTKMWWNDTNEPTMTTFWWQGLDGSKVLTHFPHDYNNKMRGGDLLRYLERNREADRVKDLLFIYGWGDGGGGPSRQMAHLATRGLRNQQGLPPLKPGRAGDFFRRVERLGPDLPTWVGEHLNEFHRGVYTTQARTKRGNRLGEAALREAELWALAAHAALARDVPKPQLDRAWELLLHNQFHDVLPGSSIGRVYDLAHRDYATILSEASAVRASAQDAIAAQVDTSAVERPLVVFNPLSWARSGVVEAPGKTKTQKAVLWVENVPPCGYAVVSAASAKSDPTAALTVEPSRVETPFYSISLDDAGRFTRLFDKRAGREVLPAGRKANELLFFSDLPTNVGSDAWDINLHYREVGGEWPGGAEVRVVESGPVRAVLRVTRTVSNSTLEQDIRVYAHSPRVDFITRVDWREMHKMLKVAFPVDLRNPRATYEVQFGHLERPIHANTSWEAAHYEVPAQHWADLSEPGYGISLLNDCKHGYDVCDGALRLTLLRAPKGPDGNADLGQHEFTYSLWPHPGDFREGRTVQAGYELAFPLTAVATTKHRGMLPASRSWLSVEPESVVVEAVKPPEEGAGLILRVYEAHGARAEATVHFGLDVASVEEVDLIERPIAAVPLEDGVLRFAIQPFEIRTFRVVMR
jgi:alpha-mannosidase